MNKKKYGHFLRSKHIPNRIKLIRKLNKCFSWQIPEETKISRDGNSQGLKTGWFFNWHFVYDGRIYGAMESITDMLKYKSYKLYDNGRHIEIEPVV